MAASESHSRPSMTPQQVAAAKKLMAIFDETVAMPISMDRSMRQFSAASGMYQVLRAVIEGHDILGPLAVHGMDGRLHVLLLDEAGEEVTHG